MPRRATKIVATLGPASSDPFLLEQMIRAGVNVVRLNFSHGKAQDHVERARLVREAAKRAGREVAIMADLQGPKIRVGKFAEGKVFLQPGQTFVLDAARTELGDIDAVGLDYKSLPREVKAGDVLLLNDGLIVIVVDHVKGEAIYTTVRMGGELSNNKGINKQGGGLTAPALTAKDMEDIRTAMSFHADYVAVSFPKNATDMEMARQLCSVAAEDGHRPGLIAKIERAEAIPHLEEILLASDGIMVARGDLAVEVGNAVVPALQKRMIKLAREHDRVVITATQMMESMITNPVPTRAEVSDVANAVLDGTDAVRARSGLYRQDLQPHRPDHRHGGVVYRTSSWRQSHCGHDRQRFDRVVDEPPPDPGADLRPDLQNCHATQNDLVSQCAAAVDRHQRRPRHRAGRGRGRSQGTRHCPDRRCLRHHLRRAHGLPWRHQHAQDLPGGLARSIPAMAGRSSGGCQFPRCMSG
jgi:hypothetical protein